MRSRGEGGHGRKREAMRQIGRSYPPNPTETVTDDLDTDMASYLPSQRLLLYTRRSGLRKRKHR